MNREIFVLIEHRQGEIRDISFEMLTKARGLAQEKQVKVCALLFGTNLENLIEKTTSFADKVLVVEDKKLENFNAECYQRILANLLPQYNPFLTLIGHTAFGVDLAPSLAAQLNFPLVTDCVDLKWEDERLEAIRQMYGGKVNARISLMEASSYLATIRQAAFPVGEGNLKAEVVKIESLLEEIAYRKFIEYLEAAVGEVDITKANTVIAVGRGIKEQKNLALVEDLAKTLGGVLACSRPVVDAGWLPKDRQVGSSGKTVKPKLYIAIGISGAFQHISGMKNAETIIAINKDPNAPIFAEAHYGIVGDLFKVVPVLKEKIAEIKR
ncbi:MAG: electron transfer flavoprotein subunit alpha/FixB family protein [Candidatus Edwardsbacteria bacterium]